VYSGGHKKIHSAANKKGVVSRSDGGNGEQQAFTRRVESEVGNIFLFDYYFFLRKYGRDPLNIEDFYDGLRSLKFIVELEGPRL